VSWTFEPDWAVGLAFAGATAILDEVPILGKLTLEEDLDGRGVGLAFLAGVGEEGAEA
jgi:hypothetical protein